MRYALVPLVILLITFAHDARANDWPCWRGPDGLGASMEKKLPIRWTASENIKWKIPNPGKGASSPIVVGKRVYLTYQTADTALHVAALDPSTGKAIWDQ